MTGSEPIEPEFSRVLALDRLNLGPVTETLRASESECAALAERFGIPGIARLTGTLEVTRPGQGPAIRVTGEVSGNVTQTCVVSLERFSQAVTETFVQRYTLEEVAEPQEVFSDPDAEEPPEPIVGDTLDLGEILAEQLALALDPYPHAPGAQFEGASFGAGDDADVAPVSPFAALKDLKTSGDGG
jgi:uncharacterized metal-binding protein YceD (DUF177 family)